MWSNFGLHHFRINPIFLDKPIKCFLEPLSPCPCNWPNWNLQWVLWCSLFLINSLNQFYAFTGLRANTSNSCVFIAEVEDGIADSICQSLNFTRGLKYLAVPLMSSRLEKEDCVDLINRLTHRVQSWASKFLSYAG